MVRDRGHCNGHLDGDRENQPNENDSGRAPSGTIPESPRQHGRLTKMLTQSAATAQKVVIVNGNQELM